MASESRQSSSAKILLQAKISLSAVLGSPQCVPNGFQPDFSILVEFLQKLREEALKGDLSSFSCFLDLSDEWLSLSGDIFILRLSEVRIGTSTVTQRTAKYLGSTCLGPTCRDFHLNRHLDHVDVLLARC